MTSNLPVRRGCLILAHLMNGELKPMKMPSYLKKKLKYGMIRDSKSVSLKLENMFVCTTLVFDSGLFRKVSFMCSSGVIVWIIYFSTLMGVPEI